jgi:glutaredoxin-like protein NrdH
MIVMVVVKVEGEKRDHTVFLYTLSTCGWCKRTKEFLKEQGVEYEYMDVDTCTSEERRATIADLKARSAPMGFPLAIIDDETIISGYKPDRYKEALGL